ncbi:MAG: hypothetical protein CR984_03745 [Proteobacteria bacterium]|nr:MAG: hypothetical protein CR984_03745 [Pseudomonadota bacterium]
MTDKSFAYKLMEREDFLISISHWLVGIGFTCWAVYALITMPTKLPLAGVVGCVIWLSFGGFFIVTFFGALLAITLMWLCALVDGVTALLKAEQPRDETAPIHRL